MPMLPGGGEEIASGAVDRVAVAGDDRRLPRSDGAPQGVTVSRIATPAWTEGRPVSACSSCSGIVAVMVGFVRNRTIVGANPGRSPLHGRIAQGAAGGLKTSLGLWEPWRG